MHAANQQQTAPISVVIPAYNAGATISRAVESVLAQTRRPTEIIVIDDGSTDDTAQKVKSYGPDVRYLHQENAGAGAARNAGIAAATCPRIAFLDGDDEWLANKLLLQIEHLERHPELVWTFSNLYLCPDATKSRRLGHPKRPRRSTTPSDECFQDYLTAFASGLYAWTSTLVIKRQVLEEVGGFDASQPRGQDTDLWLRIAYRYPAIGYLTEPLATYHTSTPDSITKKYRHLPVVGNLVERHLQLAEQHGKLEAFKPCAVRMVKVALKEMIDADDKNEVHSTVNRFAQLLTWPFKLEVRLRLAFPKLAATGFDLYASIKGLCRTSLHILGFPKR